MTETGKKEPEGMGTEGKPRRWWEDDVKEDLTEIE
jgi:hypothetical protein